MRTRRDFVRPGGTGGRIFYVRDGSYEEDSWDRVRAYDAEEAAENWADLVHSESDYPSEFDSVEVQDQEDGVVTKWRVVVDTAPVFRAQEVEADDERGRVGT